MRCCRLAGASVLTSQDVDDAHVHIYTVDMYSKSNVIQHGEQHAQRPDVARRPLHRTLASYNTSALPGKAACVMSRALHVSVAAMNAQHGQCKALRSVPRHGHLFEARPCADSILGCASCCAPRGPQQVTLALVQAGAALLQPAAAQGVPCGGRLLRPAAAVPAAVHRALVVALAALAQQHHLLCQHWAGYVFTSPALLAMQARARSSALLGNVSP